MGDIPAVRRTFEVVIMQVWHCDSRAAEMEFDRALSVGEVETFGVVGTQMAYKCKT
jgi:cyclopropane fatty-acyl-phospholipid synthase-like methyltransferase